MSWRMDNNDIEECDGLECLDLKNVPKVLLTIQTQIKIDTLLKEYTHSEWLCGLVGYYDKTENEYKIEDLVIAEQEVSSAFCELTKDGTKEMNKVKTIGWIHSHNTMEVFHSSTDVHQDKQNTVSITVNNKKEFDVKIKYKTKCGLETLAESEILLETEELSDDEWLDEAKNVIKKKTYKVYGNHQTEFCEDDDWDDKGYNKCFFCYKKLKTDEDKKWCEGCDTVCCSDCIITINGIALCPECMRGHYRDLGEDYLAESMLN